MEHLPRLIEGLHQYQGIRQYIAVWLHSNLYERCSNRMSAISSSLPTCLSSILKDGIYAGSVQFCPKTPPNAAHAIGHSLGRYISLSSYCAGCSCTGLHWTCGIANCSRRGRDAEWLRIAAVAIAAMTGSASRTPHARRVATENCCRDVHCHSTHRAIRAR